MTGGKGFRVPGIMKNEPNFAGNPFEQGPLLKNHAQWRPLPLVKRTRRSASLQHSNGAPRAIWKNEPNLL
jgi:hypothetical protein